MATEKAHLTRQALKDALEKAETCPYKPTERCDGAEVSTPEFCGGCGVYRKRVRGEEQ